MPKVTGLYVFPVKSLGGLSVDKVQIGSTGGVSWDRTWLITREDGRFLTQRQHPKMALIQTFLPPEVLCTKAEDTKLAADAALVMKAPSMEPLQVLLEPTSDLPLRTVNVTCWEWAGTARDEGDAAALWLSEYLGKPVRLVRYMGKAGAGDADGDPARRPVDPEFAKGYENTFSDGFPIHLTAEESLRDLNKRLEAPLPMDRFRANIVVAGDQPWAEDDWAGLKIGGLEFDSVKPCGRCKEGGHAEAERRSAAQVTTTDQATAEVGLEPLKTLSEFRSGRVLGWNSKPSYKREFMFGWNLVTQDRGTLTVGDEVEITRMRPADELVV